MPNAIAGVERKLCVLVRQPSVGRNFGRTDHAVAKISDEIMRHAAVRRRWAMTKRPPVIGLQSRCFVGVT
jgi:hypothetical protein